MVEDGGIVKAVMLQVFVLVSYSSKHNVLFCINVYETIPLKMSWKHPVGSSKPIKFHITDILNETIKVLKLGLNVDHISLTSAL